MTNELRPAELGETATLEVRVLRDGVLVHRELCESEAEAAAVMGMWEETPGTACTVTDLAAPDHRELVPDADRAEPVDLYPDDIP